MAVSKGGDVAAWLGVVLAIAALGAIAVMIVVNPSDRTVTGVYAAAATHFFRGENIYTPEASDGFLYLPLFAMIYFPFNGLGAAVGNLLWRAVGVVLLGFALRRTVRRLNSGRDTSQLMGMTLLFAICGAAGAVRNGQSTVLLLTATLLAFEAAYDRRFVGAAAWATFAVVSKPLGIVVWLSIAGTRRKSVPWLLAFLIVALLAPAAFVDVKYVYYLYSQFFAMLTNVSPELGRDAPWTDFMALFRALGLSVDTNVVAIIRAVAAFMTYLGLLLLTRKDDYLTASLIPATFACSYMLLFNPRAEINTYILMAVPYGLVAAYLLRATDRTFAGVVVAVACVALGTGALGPKVMKLFDPWSKPVLLIVCLGVCYAAVLRNPTRNALRMDDPRGV